MTSLHSDLKVRPMAVADLDAVLRIQAACYTAIEPESRESLQAKLQAAPDTCFVAVADQQPVAYAIAVPVAFPELPVLDQPHCDPPPHADALYLHDVAVSPTLRGSGAAGALVRRVMDAARHGQWRQMCLIAIQGSSSYWARHGFREVAPREMAAKLASYGADARFMWRGAEAGA